MEYVIGSRLIFSSVMHVLACAEVISHGHGLQEFAKKMKSPTDHEYTCKLRNSTSHQVID